MDGNVWNMDGHVFKKMDGHVNDWYIISSHAFKLSWSIFQLCLMRTKKYHFIGMKENMLRHFNVFHALKPESSVDSFGFVFFPRTHTTREVHRKTGQVKWGGNPSFTRSGACCSKIFTKCCLRAAFPMAKRHNRRRKAYFLGTSLHQHVQKLIRSIEWISLVDKRATTR